MAHVNDPNRPSEQRRRREKEALEKEVADEQDKADKLSTFMVPFYTQTVELIDCFTPRVFVW